MTSHDSLARSHSLTSRFKPNLSTPKMNGGHHYSRVSKNKEPITNENNPPYSTPGSPSSSGQNSAITVAERRQTKVSKYLVSEDFKADFATKLNRLRQREKNMDSTEVIVKTSVDHDQSIIEDDESQGTDNHDTTDTTLTSTVYTANHAIDPTDSSDVHQIRQSASPDRYQALHGAEPIQETEDPGYASSTSNQKERPSSRHPSYQPGEEDPEEQSARYEVISKLADQLAEQIEENDSLLYELGVVRSNNARLQAVTADKEDEVACLNQRNRQLELIIAQFNSSKPAEGSKDYREAREVAQVLLSQLNQIHDNLCQLLVKGSSKHKATVNPSQCEIKSATQTRHGRRYSWSGAQAKCLVGYAHETLRKPACVETNNEDVRHLSGQWVSAQATLGQDFTTGWTGFVDQNDRESMKAHIHWLQAELINSRSIQIATDAALQSLIDSITQRTKRSNVEPCDNQVQGLGLFSGSTPERALRPLNSNAGEASSRGATAVRSLSEEHQNTSSPLLALASFGFPSWGRKPDSVSPPKQTNDEEPGIPSLNTISEQSPAATEKEGAFKRFGLRSFFNTAGSPLSKPDPSLTPSPSVLAVNGSPPDPSRRLPNRSSTVAVMSRSQAASLALDENADPLPEDLDNENNPHLLFQPHLDPNQLPSIVSRLQVPGDDSKDPFLHGDDHLILDGTALHSNPNAILI